VAALKLLVGIVKSERAAAQAVWPPGAPEAEQAFDEVVSRSVVAATHAGAFIVASKRTPEKVCFTASTVKIACCLGMCLHMKENCKQALEYQSELDLLRLLSGS
jgi:hypothetical protein